MQPNYSAADFRKIRDWVPEAGGHTFPTLGSLEWFIRQHRQELLESGELILRRGAGGTLIGPNFGRLAIAIMQREALKRGAA